MKKYTPILYSPPMVRSILEGRKTKTRRIIKPQPLLHNDVIKLPIGLDAYAIEMKKQKWSKKGYTQIYINGPLSGMLGPKCRYQPGDILWVKETFTVVDYFLERRSLYIQCEGENADRLCKLTSKELDKFEMWKRKLGRKSSLFMFKSLSRIWLEVTDVRAERLHDITEQDAINEGIQLYEGIDNRPRYRDYLSDASGYGHPDHDYPSVGLAVTSFSTLWRKINGEESWEQNPWVWVVSFKVLSTTGKPKCSSYENAG
jgi:hypothetical protein